jgi:hypothetical protein
VHVTHFHWSLPARYVAARNVADLLGCLHLVCHRVVVNLFAVLKSLFIIMESDRNITCFCTKYTLSTNPSRSAADS